MRLPVAAATLSASATSDAAPAKSPGPRRCHAELRRGGAAAARARRRRGRAGPAAPAIACSASTSQTTRWRPWPSSPTAGRPPRGCATSASAARCSAGAAAARPSVVSSARPSSSRSSGRGAPGGRRERLDGAADLEQDVRALRAARRRSPRPTRQVRLARELQVERLEPPRGVQQQRRSIAAEARGERDLGRAAGPPGRAGTRRAARPPPWPASPSAASNAPAWRLA